MKRIIIMLSIILGLMACHKKDNESPSSTTSTNTTYGWVNEYFGQDINNGYHRSFNYSYYYSSSTNEIIASSDPVSAIYTVQSTVNIYIPSSNPGTYNNATYTCTDTDGNRWQSTSGQVSVYQSTVSGRLNGSYNFITTFYPKSGPTMTYYISQGSFNVPIK